MTAPHLRKLCVVNLVTGERRLVSREEAGPLPPVEVVGRDWYVIPGKLRVVCRSRWARHLWGRAAGAYAPKMPVCPWAAITPDADHTEAELVAIAWAWLVARANPKG